MMAVWIHQLRWLTVLCLVSCTGSVAVMAQEVPQSLMGDWSLQLDSKTPAWLSVQEQDSRAVVFFRLYVGSAGPYRNVTVEDGRLKFVLKKKRKATAEPATVELGLKGGQLDGVIVRPQANGTSERIQFTG